MTVRAAALVLALFMLPVFSASRARAATYEDINQPEVFLRQETKITCTLASATMLIRRAAMMNGNADWASITESAVKKVAWSNGLRYTFTYAGIKINHESSSFTRATLSALINQHPEGIVIYVGNNKTYTHAVLLTDYIDGVFYCADPADANGKETLTQSTYKKYWKSEDTIISKFTAYWYVESPSVSLSAPYPVNFDANGGTDAPSRQTKIEGVPLVLSSAQPTRTDYFFVGWNSAPDGSGTDYAPGAVYTGNESLTLYAQWIPAVWGDANGDGKVSNSDVVRLKNYLANYEQDTNSSSELISQGADANGDGKVDNKDVVRMKNYLANYDEEIQASTVSLGPASLPDEAEETGLPDLVQSASMN